MTIGRFPSGLATALVAGAALCLVAADVSVSVDWGTQGEVLHTVPSVQVRAVRIRSKHGLLTASPVPISPSPAVHMHERNG